MTGDRRFGLIKVQRDSINAHYAITLASGIFAISATQSPWTIMEPRSATTRRSYVPLDPRAYESSATSLWLAR
jgi:hypothetical protein